MKSYFVDLVGERREFDLDKLVAVSRGFSDARKGWTGTLVYSPDYDVFIELRSSEPDILGNSRGEVAQVSEGYAVETYDLTYDTLRRFRVSAK